MAKTRKELQKELMRDYSQTVAEVVAAPGKIPEELATAAERALNACLTAGVPWAILR